MPTETTTPDINEILARPENSGCSKYGADMGRRSQRDGQPECLHLQRLRWVDSDYDTGGAYWGGGIGHIYCAFSPDDTENDPPIRIFVRAKSREEAKTAVLDEVKEEGLTFVDDFASDSLIEMVQAYVRAALWSTTDNSTPQGGQPFDANYSHDDLDPESLARMTADCKAFADAVQAQLPFVIKEADPTDLGHDFWLTRNGHGCGFWDGDYRWLDRDGSNVGRSLTWHAKRFKERSLELGDDGKVYEIGA